MVGLPITLVKLLISSPSVFLELLFVRWLLWFTHCICEMVGLPITLVKLVIRYTCCVCDMVGLPTALVRLLVYPLHWWNCWFGIAAAFVRWLVYQLHKICEMVSLTIVLVVKLMSFTTLTEYDNSSVTLRIFYRLSSCHWIINSLKSSMNKLTFYFHITILCVAIFVLWHHQTAALLMINVKSLLSAEEEWHVSGP